MHIIIHRREFSKLEKKIMLGNEAIARGAWEAGVKVSSAYPGTPSTEMQVSKGHF